MECSSSDGCICLCSNRCENDKIWIKEKRQTNEQCRHRHQSPTILWSVNIKIDCKVLRIAHRFCKSWSIYGAYIECVRSCNVWIKRKPLSVQVTKQKKARKVAIIGYHPPTKKTTNKRTRISKYSPVQSSGYPALSSLPLSRYCLLLLLLPERIREVDLKLGALRQSCCSYIATASCSGIRVDRRQWDV